MAFSDSHRILVIAFGLPSLMLGYDFSGANLALPAIQQSFDCSLPQLQWLMLAFGLGLAPTLMCAGQLGDRIGHPKTLDFALFGFCSAALLGAVSDYLLLLMAARFIQGLCAATFIPCSVAVVSTHIQPLDQRTPALAWLGGLLGIGFAIGPIISK